MLRLSSDALRESSYELQLTSEIEVYAIYFSLLGSRNSPEEAGLPKARNTEEDTEDKTEIVVKKMRTVISLL